MKTSAERVASLLDKFPEVAQSIVDKVRFCDHIYIVVSKKTSSNSEHATQFMCQKCCTLMPMKTMAQVNEDVTNLLSILPESGVFQKVDGS